MQAYRHYCPHDYYCEYKQDINHLQQYIHSCLDGANCQYVYDVAHATLFYHPQPVYYNNHSNYNPYQTQQCQPTVVFGDSDDEEDDSHWLKSGSINAVTTPTSPPIRPTKGLCKHRTQCSTGSCTYRHACPSGSTCKDKSSTHRRDFVHCCDKSTCTETNDHVHTKLHWHKCPNDATCQDQTDDHRDYFLHTCKYGSDCRNVSNQIHAARYYHPCKTQNCSDKSQLHRDFFHSGETPLIPQLINPFVALTVSPTTPHKYLSLVDKNTLTHVVSNWHYAARADAVYKNQPCKFVGWEVNPHDKCSITQKVVISMNGSYMAVNHPDITVDTTTIQQPWHHRDVKVFKNQKIADAMDVILKTPVGGLHNQTMGTVMDRLYNRHSICTFIIGGAIRDTIISICNNLPAQPCKDIDIGFSTSATEMEAIMQKENWIGQKVSTGRIEIGRVVQKNEITLEGKAINSFNNDMVSDHHKPQCIGNDLYVENVYRDFTIGAIWYDPVNKAIIDPTGHGVEDALTMKLRIPVPKNLWPAWVRGNPSKLMRYYKHRANGYTAIDQETDDFITDCVTKGCNGKTFSANEMNCANTLSKGVHVGHNKDQKKQNFKKVLVDSLGHQKVQQLFPGL